MKDTETNKTDAPASHEPQLGLNDLYALVQIVDLASTRGAFRATELTQIGAVHDRISAFLEFAGKQAETNENVKQMESV